MGLPVSRLEYSSIFSGKVLMKACTRSKKVEGRLHGEAADADVAGHHALAGDGLKEAENVFALAEGVKEDGERANVHGVRAQPDQVGVEAAELGKQNAQPLGLGGNLQAEQLFHGQAVTKIVGQRVKIVDAVGERNHLLVELGLAGLLDAGVQVADLGIDADNDFAVDLQHQAQNAVGGRVLRAHVNDHVLVVCAFSRVPGRACRAGCSFIGSPPPDSPCARDGPANRRAS